MLRKILIIEMMLLEKRMIKEWWELDCYTTCPTLSDPCQTSLLIISKLEQTD